MFNTANNPLSELQRLQQKNANAEYDDWQDRRNQRSLTSSITGGMGYKGGSDDYFQKMWDREDEQFLSSWLKTGRGPNVSHSYRGTSFAERPSMAPPGQARPAMSSDQAGDAHAAHWLNQANIRRANADASRSESYALDADFGGRVGQRNVDQWSAEAPIRADADQRMEAYLKGRYLDPAEARGAGRPSAGGRGSGAPELPSFDPSAIIGHLGKIREGLSPGTPDRTEKGWFPWSKETTVPGQPADPRRASIDQQIQDLVKIYTDRANGQFGDDIPEFGAGGEMAPPQQGQSRTIDDVRKFAQANGMSEAEALKLYQSHGYAVR
jgi:hypothetical protein